MTTDHLTPEQEAEVPLFFGDGSGWGFGVGVVARRVDLASTPGRFGWAGNRRKIRTAESPRRDGSRSGRHLAPRASYASTVPRTPCLRTSENIPSRHLGE
jgi:hypothetical protein